ncbi:MAG TPA: enoyl-CoA hydratase/isomerase family protein [Xanthobacteraceae bacterium]|nr:enoyl-CoA hydratase/isomerase family protein [Xanthobacteraceae bacterium]
MIDISLEGNVAVATMRHSKANAMDIEFCEAIAARFEELKQSKAKAVVLVGEGKIFSAGVDLVRALEGGADYFHRFLPALSKAFITAFFFPKPLVAAVNGHAIAGGCVLACCADRRLMAKGTARIGIPELLVGVPFPTIALEVMRFTIAARFIQDVFLTGATYLPEEALPRGLADEIVEPGDLMRRAIAAAEHFAAIRTEAFAITKLQLRQPVADRCVSETQRFEAAVNELWSAPEAFERIRAYVSRTFKKV